MEEIQCWRKFNGAGYRFLRRKGLVKLLEFEIKYKGAENLGIKLKKILEVIKGGLMS